MQVPVGESEDFYGIIDVLTRKMATFSGDMGQTIEWSDFPEEYTDKVDDLYERIVEAACDVDDVLAEKYLNEEPISFDEI